MVPDDPYMTARLNHLRRQYNLLTCANGPIEDNYKLKQFIKYDGIILRYLFDVIVCKRHIPQSNF